MAPENLPEILISRLESCLGSQRLPLGLRKAIQHMGERDLSDMQHLLHRRELQIEQMSHWQDTLYRLYDLLPIGLCSIDRHLTLHRLNAAMAQMCGMNRDGLPGHAVSQFFDEQTIAQLQSMILGLPTDGQTVGSLDGHLRTAQDKQLAIRLTPLCLTPDLQGLSPILLVVEDTTEIVAHTEALHRVMECTPVGLCITDSEGFFTYVNPAYIKLYGYQPEQLLGQHFTKIVPDALKPQLSALHDAFIAGQSEARGEWEVRTASGKALTVLADAARLPAENGGWQKATFVIDISQRKEQEKALEQAKEMAQKHFAAASAANRELQEALTESKRAKAQAERATAIKAEFLAHMSHEIRTPLNGILGMLSVIKDPHLSADSIDALATARRAGEHLLDLLNNVLDSSALEEGRLYIEKSPFSLAALCADVMALFKPQFAGKGIACQLKLPNNLTQRVLGDHGRIRQILGNLLSNAGKFTEQGAVTLALNESAPGWYEFRVSDTGNGISPEALTTIFEPFTQTGPQHLRRMGTGLGLTISKRLAETMGGSIDVKSSLGQGTTFRLLLPLPSQQDNPSTASWNISDSAANGDHAFNEQPMVLVVEDNAVNQKVVKALLERMGVSCDIAASGTEALNQAGAKPYAAIFMDIQLPDMDGYALTAALRQQYDRLNEVPIIALTASSDAENERRCQEAGMAGMVGKPIRPDHLMQTLDQALTAAKRSKH